MAFHSRFGPATGNHILPKWQFPTEADLLAFTNESSGNPANAGPPIVQDVNGVGWAVAENTLFVLKNHSPVTWEPLGDTASALRHTGPVPSVLPIADLQPGQFLLRDPVTDEIVSGDPPPFSVERTVTVANSGADATNIKEALDIIATFVPPPDFNNPVAIEVFTGFYFEPGPFPYVIPDGCIIVGDAPETTALIPADPTATLFTASGISTLESIAIEELFDAGGTGLIADGNTASIRLRNVWFRGVLSPIVMTNAATVDISDCRLQAFGGDPVVDAIALSGNALLLARGLDLLGSPFGSPWKAGVNNDDGTALLTSTLFQTCERAVFGQAGISRVFSSRVVDSSVETFRCETGELNLIGSTVSSQLGSLELVQNGGSVVFDSSSVRKDRIVTNAGTSILGINSLVPGEEEFFNLRNISVGGALAGQGRSAFFAQGSPTVRTVTVLQNDNLEAGTWTDITAEITSPEGPPVDIFPALTAGASIYIGADYIFYATVATLVDALGTLNPLADVLLEIWNGVAWIDPNYMATKFTGANEQYARNILVNPGKNAIRLGTTSAWQTRDIDPGPGPINKYWLRMRLVNAVASQGTVQELKILPTSVRVSEDGVIEFFGPSRPLRELDWNRQSLDPQQGLAPLSGLIAVSPSITLETKENLFPAASLAAVNGLIDIELGLDTSLPLRLEVRAFSTGGTGQFEIGVIVALITAPATYSGLNPQAPFSIILPVVAPFQEIVVETELNVSILQPGDRLAFQLSRFGGAGLDTSPDDMILESTTIRMNGWAG